MSKRERGIHELYAADPLAADERLWGRRAPAASRRGFLRGAGLTAMSAALGAAIPYAARMPAGLIPAALAGTDEPFRIPGKDGLRVLNDRPLNAETPAHLLDDPITPTARHFIRNNGLPPEEAPGLTFDAEFVPDYWINYNTGSIPVEEFIDSALLRTDGAKTNAGGFPLDYGCFFGVVKDDGLPICYTGPNIDVQDGFTSDLFSSYPPRNSNEAMEMAIDIDPFDPDPTPFVVGNLLKGTIDNSNIRGITDSDGTGGEEVQTGLELAIDLDELGWDGESPIRVGGHISSGDFGFVSNQVIGGLPDGTGNLEEVTLVNYANIDGDQFVVVPVGGGDPCPSPIPDCNDDNLLNILDFVCYQGLFASGDPGADCNGDSMLNILDFVCYQGAFAAGGAGCN